MIDDQILKEVNEVFVRVFANPSIVVGNSTTAKDIAEWDSLNHTILIGEVERHFKIKFSLKEVMRFQNVGDMCVVIRTKLGNSPR
jgi:acyl carrier protein